RVHAGGGEGGLMLRRLVPLLALALAAACGSSGPQPIMYDADACEFCRMQISDPRFGAEIVTKKGRPIKFDSIECLVSYYKQAAAASDVASVWVSDFLHPGTLIDASTARFVDLGPGRAPLGRGWAAIASGSDAAALGITDPAAVKRWSDLL
ncbi:MAG TPA: nitrous oxide reductase accessory protein NosL, partial [Gemmatimonadaceae bacterium]|nr:nitrous oxide reductase accessory protein NosL [Gemmatimonadaceae bacterium]